MKQRLFIVLTLFFLLSNTAHGQQWRLEEQIGGASNNYGSCVAFDRAGNRYVAGVTRGRSQFNDNTLYGGSVWCAYVAKYDQLGNLLWVQAPGVCTDSLSDIYINAIAADSSGNLYIAGKYLGSASFFGVAHTSIGASEIYVAKLRSTGDVAWLKTAGGVGQGPFGQNSANAISLDKAGNCYLTGSYNKSILFDTITVSAFPTTMLFIAKYDSDGNIVWAKSGADSSIISSGRGIATESDGSSTFTGIFFGSLTIGTFTLVAGDNEQKMFIAKCDPEGDIIWAHEVGSGGYYGNANDIAVDPTGNSYLVCSFDATIDFGGGVQYSYNNQRRYILLAAKYDPNGNFVWANATSGSDQESNASKIAVDNYGNSFVTGSFRYSTSFGNTTLSKPDNNAAFIAQLNPVGEFVSANAAGGFGYNAGNGIALAPSGDIAIVGEFDDTIQFGQRQMISGGGSDVFSVLITAASDDVQTITPEAKEIQFYPNPANLELHSTKKDDLVIVDLLGHVVLNCADCDRVDVGNLPAGNYYVNGMRIVIRH